MKLRTITDSARRSTAAAGNAGGAHAGPRHKKAPAPPARTYIYLFQ
jgi:hypothetical protein